MPDQEGRDEFLRHFENVSRETIWKLERYAELLGEWNGKFNLIGESTLPIIWRRHFLDSAQLIKFMPGHVGTLADLGSGAGFPGIVLGIMGVHKVHLIESVGKKAEFLRMLVAELKLDIDVHSVRIESMHGIRFHVVTARALKPFPELLKLSKPLMSKDSIALFLKGRSAAAELTDSGKYWTFDCETFPSLSDHSGNVMKISNLEFLSRKPAKRVTRGRK